jgi:hypothetical protein
MPLVRTAMEGHNERIKGQNNPRGTGLTSHIAAGGGACRFKFSSYSIGPETRMPLGIARLRTDPGQ